MATGIPLPGQPINSLMTGVNTGSSMFARIMQPIIEREKQKQLESHFQEELKLRQAAAGRNASLFQERMKELKNKNDPLYPYKQYKALEDYVKSQGMGGGQSAGNEDASYPALNKMFAGQGMFPEGELSHGNIDLGNRPEVPNPETGGTSTVYSMGIGTPEGETLIPRVSDDGRILSEQEAIDHFHKTGKHLGVYSSPDEANRAAQLIHQQQETLMNKRKAQGANAPGLFNRDLLTQNPMLRGLAKKIMGYDPLSETPEQKRDLDFQSHAKLENLKAENKTKALEDKEILAVKKDLPTLEKSLASVRELKRIAHDNPSMFGHGFMPDRYAKTTNIKDFGKWQNLIGDAIAGLEQKLSSKGNIVALKMAAQLKPSHAEQQNVAIGKLESMENQLLDTIKQSRGKIGKTMPEPQDTSGQYNENDMVIVEGPNGEETMTYAQAKALGAK